MDRSSSSTARTLEALSRLSRIEDIFAFFGLVPEPRLLAEHGKSIFRSWAQEVAEIEHRKPLPAEDDRLHLFGEALRDAHAEIARGRVPRSRLRVIQGGRRAPGPPPDSTERPHLRLHPVL